MNPVAVAQPERHILAGVVGGDEVGEALAHLRISCSFNEPSAATSARIALSGTASMRLA